MNCSAPGHRSRVPAPPGKRCRGAVRVLAVIMTPLLLAACVSYSTRPLPASTQWISHPHDASGQPLQRISLGTAVKRALRDNRGYAAALVKARISVLQLRRAGLLPDPQFSASLEKPTTPGPYVNGFTAALSQDLSWLLTRGARKDAARARLTQTRLQVAWQGWTLVQKTASDYVDLWFTRRQCDLLQQQQDRLATQQAALDRALKRSDITMQQDAAALTTLSQVQAQLTQARQARITAQAALNSDMNLAPQVRYTLLRPKMTPLPDPQAVQSALQSLPHTRPDLLALTAGYRAANADFRAAVLAQFPGISVDVSRNSDTSAVFSNIIGISLNLPIFGRSRNTARLARATRDELHAVYAQRLNDASSQAQTLYARLYQTQSRQATLRQQLPRLKQLSRNANKAFAAGNLNGAEWSSIHQNLLARELEAMQINATLAKGRVALNALLGHVPLHAPIPHAPTHSDSGSTP
jgi:outer membrane protein TolC